MTRADLVYTPATELGSLLRTRALSPVELVDAVLARIEERNPHLAAYITVTGDLARAQAKAAEGRMLRGEALGPLDGIPFSIKDLEPTAGIRTTFGSKWHAEHVPDADSLVVSRLRQTGAVLLGKTNVCHFGHKFSSDNLIGPPGRNPWCLERTPGGSSGGAAAAVAAGMGPVAHGSDGGGSIRVPASFCGVVGFKPSAGRIPGYPSLDFWGGSGTSGPLSRTVRDSALLLQAMAGPDPRDPLSIDAAPDDYLAACDGDLQGLRVAWSTDFGYAPVEPAVRTLFEAAVVRLADAGCTLEEREPGWADPAPWHKVQAMGGAAANWVDQAAAHPDWVEPSMMWQILSGTKASAIEYARARWERSRFYTQVQRFFEQYDLLLTPMMPVTAWSVAPDSEPMTIDGRPTPTIVDRVPFSYIFNQTGHPAISVPCGFTEEGLPVGLQIVGRWHADSTVLRAAACFEAIQPWAEQRPPDIDL